MVDGWKDRQKDRKIEKSQKNLSYTGCKRYSTQIDRARRISRQKTDESLVIDTEIDRLINRVVGRDEDKLAQKKGGYT